MSNTKLTLWRVVSWTHGLDYTCSLFDLTRLSYNAIAIICLATLLPPQTKIFYRQRRERGSHGGRFTRAPTNLLLLLRGIQMLSLTPTMDTSSDHPVSSKTTMTSYWSRLTKVIASICPKYNLWLLKHWAVIVSKLLLLYFVTCIIWKSVVLRLSYCCQHWWQYCTAWSFYWLDAFTTVTWPCHTVLGSGRYLGQPDWSSVCLVLGKIVKRNFLFLSLFCKIIDKPSLFFFASQKSAQKAVRL